jgi:eukaryotic-like serine/threonine-protein kinase
MGWVTSRPFSHCVVAGREARNGGTMTGLDEEAIFQLARQVDRPDARRLYLDQACGPDADLRARLDALLRAHDEERSFLERPALPPPVAPGPETAALTPGTPAAYDGPPPAIGAHIGPYKLLQQIGEGGMGTVFMAEQTEPVKRQVALKVIKVGMDSRQVVARFEAERQALALMDHVNIARVFDGGATDAGRPYFVMELVHGVPITKYCDDHHLTPRERLELFVPVCQAIQHAHQKGVIHRDIKPTNVMVTLYDGKPVPKVIDFGVAKATEQKLTERTLFTQYGTMVGTLEYMSPEQAEMSALGVDTRSDIYSLGVLLYELLTGNTPLTHKRMQEGVYAEILRMIKEEEPPKPSTRLSDSGEALASISVQRHMEPARLTKLVRGELDWIVMKTLEKDRNRRYETAKDFAADVQRYLSDETVQACPPSAWYRFRKLARRNKAGLITAGLLALALLAGTLVSAWQATRATQAEGVARIAADGERDKAREADEQRVEAHRHAGFAKEQQARAEQGEQNTRRHLYAAHMNLAQQASESGDIAQALDLLERQRPGPDREDLRGFEWYYLWRLCYRGHRLTLRGHGGIVLGVAVSRDGKTLASASSGGTLKLWDMPSGKVRATLQGHTGAIWSVAFSPDGLTLASAGEDNTVRLWDVATGEEQATLRGHLFPVRSVAFSPDGKTLASGAGGHFPRRGEVKLWDVAERRERSTLQHDAMVVTCVAFSPGGKMLAWSTEDSIDPVRTGGVIKLWDLLKGRERHSLPCNGATESIAFSPDGRTMASTGDDFSSTGKEVTLWEVETGQKQATLAGQNRALAVAFSPDGMTLATSGRNKTVMLWDLATRHARKFGHAGAIWSLAFSPDGKALASGSADGSVNVWDTAAQPEQQTLVEGSIGRCVEFSPDGKTIAFGTMDGSIRLWDAVTLHPRATLKGHTGAITRLVFSPDNKTLFSAAYHEKIKLWDLATLRERDVHLQAPSQLWTLALSPDGKSLAAGGENGVVVRLWDAATWQERATFRTQGDLRAMAFTPDSATLATGGGGWPVGRTEVNLWNAATGTHVGATDRLRDWTYAIAFSPNGKIMATGDGSGEALLWDVTTWREPTALRGSGSAVSCAAFFPDNKVLVTADEEGTVKLWDVAGQQERLSLKAHASAVWSLALSPDGKTLATAGTDGKVKLWRAATDQEVFSQSSVDVASRQAAEPQDEKLRRTRAEAAKLSDVKRESGR